MTIMLPERLHWIIEAFEPEGDPWLLLQIAHDLQAEGNLEGAAAVLDRAYGLEPGAAKVRDARAAVLDRLAVREHGLVFRYIPGGPFVMGSADGDDDEKPVHPVWLAPYWLSETPLSWADLCRLMRLRAPPNGGRGGFEDQIRERYCADQEAPAGAGALRRRLRAVLGASSVRYDTKPAVAIDWHRAEQLGKRLSKGGVVYGLPTEAQWEKAARGGLIGARHAWGDQPPGPDNCDFDRFHAFEIRPSKAFAANGYGLYAMNGGVWEWTCDWYDGDYYRHAPSHEPGGPARGEEKVLRGGSWADCAEVVTVSFRMSRVWTSYGGEHRAPNFGVRLCRQVAGQRWP
jgi:formylglycine-generating enzyme required for sulfatase activity